MNLDPDSVAAYSLNRNVAAFGNALTHELESQEGKTARELENKRQKVLRRWFPSQREAQAFADPARR